MLLKVVILLILRSTLTWKKKETGRDIEFDVQEESNFDGDAADLEFWLFLKSYRSVFWFLSNI